LPRTPSILPAKERSLVNGPEFRKVDHREISSVPVTVIHLKWVRRIILAKAVTIVSLIKYAGFVGSLDLCLNVSCALNWRRGGNGGAFNDA